MVVKHLVSPFPDNGEGEVDSELLDGTGWRESHILVNGANI